MNTTTNPLQKENIEMKQRNEKARRYRRRTLGAPSIREPGRAASVTGIISDDLAAVRMQMSKRQFQEFTSEHELNGGPDFRSITELDALARKLGIPVQCGLFEENQK